MATGANDTEILQLLQIRTVAYNLLRWTFIQEPSVDFLASLAHTEVLQQFPFQEDNLTLGEGVEEVSRQVAADSFSKEETLNALHWDYTRMFIGPYKLPAPPWESAYLNKERMLFQEETLAVRRAFLKYAFIPKDFQHEADDHIGLELDFMYQLCGMMLDTLDRKATKELYALVLDQRDFLEEHLLKWAPSFCQDIINNAQTDFYSGMAKILEGYLKVDQMVLNELLTLEL